MDLSKYRERMIEAILESHTVREFNRWPVGYCTREQIRTEIENYRPYAGEDVDAIIVALTAVTHKRKTLK
jgi:hypothetical protein